jgi:mannose-6-phosphate isomerase-like protein (cupin superfamily)
MKVVPAGKTKSFRNSKTCWGEAFSFGDSELDIALVTVDGRYPQTGQVTNDVCREIAYVVSGSGSVGVDDTVHKLAAGDAVMLMPGERFWWEGRMLKMLMPCAPAFYPEQHREVA